MTDGWDIIKKLTVVALVLVLSFAIYFKISEAERHKFKVFFLNVGQGDSALIQFNDGQTMLVDCGPDSTVLSELGKALPFYERDIDVVLATHPDRDHYGGCADVVKRYNVKKIVTNGRGKPYDAYWQEWDKTMKTEGAEIVVMASPTVWKLAGDTLQFLSPDQGLKLDVAADDSNNFSIVFKLTHQDKSFLFTGDMETPLEKGLIEKYCLSENSCPTLKADVLKVGHHGSGTGSSDVFVGSVAPASAVISVGSNNSYGHPSSRVLKHLERVGARILRTDQMGAIVLK